MDFFVRSLNQSTPIKRVIDTCHYLHDTIKRVIDTCHYLHNLVTDHSFAKIAKRY